MIELKLHCSNQIHEMVLVIRCFSKCTNDLHMFSFNKVNVYLYLTEGKCESNECKLGTLAHSFIHLKIVLLTYNCFLH